MKINDQPAWIITQDGKIYRFGSWYMFSFGGYSWPGCCVTDDAGGTSHGISLDNIKTKIYTKEKPIINYESGKHQENSQQPI